MVQHVIRLNDFLGCVAICNWTNEVLIWIFLFYFEAVCAVAILLGADQMELVAI